MFEKKYDDNVLVEAYLEMHSTTKAAQELGCSYESIRRACKKNGITLDGRKHNGKNQSKKITDEELKDEIKKLSVADIARKYDMHIDRVYSRLRKLGIKVTENLRGSSTTHYLQRAKRDNYSDYDAKINLIAVYERFEGICQICGLPTDVNAREGRKIFGAYPSIDHIIPVARGGAHSWDNVQLAHMACNVRKENEERWEN